MKRFISLAILLIGFAGFASAETDVRQVTTPETTCLNTCLITNSISDAVLEIGTVFIINIPECATVPVVAFDIADKCSGFAWQIIKPPELCFLTSQATLKNYSNIMKSRAWLLHAKNLDRKQDFLLPTVRSLPVPFD